MQVSGTRGVLVTFFGTIFSKQLGNLLQKICKFLQSVDYRPVALLLAHVVLTTSWCDCPFVFLTKFGSGMRRYLRCGVVNGCTAWVHGRDPSMHLFWEEGPFGPCWAVTQNGRAPGVGGFRRLLLPSERSSSPPPERTWLRVGEPVGVSAHRPPVPR